MAPKLNIGAFLAINKQVRVLGESKNDKHRQKNLHFQL